VEDELLKGGLQRVDIVLQFSAGRNEPSFELYFSKRIENPENLSV
jgi:hypothetical protein